MRAIIVEDFDTPPKLASFQTPSAGAGQVLIRVRATGLNFADLLMTTGRYQATPAPPFALGLEVCGDVVGHGSGVNHPPIGSRVAAQVPGGGLAEYCVANAAECWTPPDTMPDATVAGFQIAYGTSHLALIRRAGLSPKEHLVVLGAAGGVGLTAVEVGKVMGAKVTAVARGEDRLAIARAAGADHLIDSAAHTDLRQAILDIAKSDVVYDAVGGDAGASAFRTLRPEGRHLLIGFASGDVPDLKLNHALVKNISLIGVYWGAYAHSNPAAMLESLTELGQWFETGRIAPRIDSVVDLEDALGALERLRRREVSGKIVVRAYSPE